MSKLPDSLVQLKDGVHAVAINGQWTTDPAAGWIVADLEKSGITPLGASDARLSFSSSRQLVGQLLNRRSPLPGGTSLLFPYFDELGKPLSYTRIKPEKPRVEERDGELRPIRYESPLKTQSELYIPPSAVPRLDALSFTLVLTEGEKKAIALNQHGYLAVAVAGVWNLLKRRDGIQKGRTFEDYVFRWPVGIPVAGRQIVLLFDSDTRTKSNLPLAIKYIVEHLKALGAVVLIAELPEGSDGEKMGADDYLVAHGPDALKQVLDAAQEPVVTKKSKNDGDSRKEKKPSAADVLAAIGMGFDLWHDADERAYASVGRRTYAVRSKGFRSMLVAKYREQTGGVPASDALGAALLTIEGVAVHDRPDHEANVRVAEFDGSVYLHLADDKDTVIMVGPDGWCECELPPVRFIRHKGMLALPMPHPGGRLEDIQRVVNVPNPPQFQLFRAWLAQAFRKRGPFPLLVLVGEQGSAKTTTARAAKRLIDPRSVDVRAEPKEVRDLMIGANTNAVLAFDNISSLPAWLSDSLCRLATGGGFGTRVLYSDDEEQTFDAKRPVILNGIEDFVTRPDLLERSLVIPHEPIEEDRRRPEAALWAEFDALAPGLLGAALDYVAGGLRELPNIKLARLPRMADFAVFAVACELGQGRDGGEFLTAYFDNQSSANNQILEESPVAAVLGQFMAGRGEWKGTATDLLRELTSLVSEKQQKDRDWPKKPNTLSNKLKRLAPSLRRTAGIDVRTGEKDTDRKRTRLIVIRRASDEGRDGSSASSGSSGDAITRPLVPDSLTGSTTGGDRPQTSLSPSAIPCETQMVCSVPDDADGADNPLPPMSNQAADTSAGCNCKRQRGRI